MEGVESAVAPVLEAGSRSEERLDRADRGEREGQAGRAPVRPRADEGRNEREHVEEVNDLAEIPVRLQPARLAEQEASDEVHLDEHAYDSERGEDERSPETEPLSVHARRPYEPSTDGVNCVAFET